MSKMKNSPRSDGAAVRRAILKQVDRYGLTTRRAVARLGEIPNISVAGKHLRVLAKLNRLYVHECDVAGRRLRYYRNVSRPLKRLEFTEKLSVLAFCSVASQKCRRLSIQEIKGLAATVGLAADSPLPKPPEIMRIGTESDQKIGLIWTAAQLDAKQIDLNALVSSLDWYVSQPRFALWHSLAALNRLVLVYLVAGQRNARELGRWLRRRPPVARAIKTPCPIDVRVKMLTWLSSI
jgi:hypothetical protein